MPHIYKAGTRLSSAYTAGVNGLPFAKHFGGRTSAAYRAWKAGRDQAKRGKRK